MKRTDDNAGFSIIELVIVALVIGVLAAAVIPRMISTSQISSLMAAELAASAIRATQSKAMFSGSAKTITFSGSTYTASGRTRALPGGATAGNYTIVFDSLGEPSTGGGGSFDISSGSHTNTVTISSITGKVTVN
jgi:prepilin-type N-terminal cleavage/methylation domain-containing protein